MSAVMSSAGSSNAEEGGGGGVGGTIMVEACGFVVGWLYDMGLCFMFYVLVVCRSDRRDKIDRLPDK